MAQILLVDDELNILNILSRILTTAGHEAETAHRGDLAITRLRETAFDLLLVDIRMDPVDGMEVLADARRMKPDMPVIMLTALDCDDTRQKAKELGAYAYITKPFRMGELLNIVDRALEEYGISERPE